MHFITQLLLYFYLHIHIHTQKLFSLTSTWCYTLKVAICWGVGGRATVASVHQSQGALWLEKLGENKKEVICFIYLFFKDGLRRVGEIKLDCELFTKFSQEQEYEAVEWWWKPVIQCIMIWWAFSDLNEAKNKLGIWEKMKKNNVINQGTKSRSDTAGMKISMSSVSRRATITDASVH